MLSLRRPALVTVLLPIASTLTLAQGPAWIDAYREPVSRIVTAATGNDFAWQRLAYLTDTFGNRLSGSQSLEDAIAWAAAEMEKDGLENVRKDPVKVPHWVRGEESLELLTPRHQSLPMLGLGLSIGTPAEGIEADLMVVESFVELERRTAEARGKIVLFNASFKGYGPTVAYRVNGASQAADAGALAVLVRSVGLDGMRTPHTGMLTYREGVPKIPAAAITSEDAARLARMAARGEKLRVRLKMGAEMLPDADSANVVAEIRGREKPEEVVVVSGHFDSWDVGNGATDDGGGAIAAWEVARLLKTLDLRPRRTIRVVLFTNEENGLRGGLDYRDRYRADLGRHVLMIESDSGAFRPLGFSVQCEDESRQGRALEEIKTLLPMFTPLGMQRMTAGHGGADIGPMAKHGVALLGFEPEGSTYFDYHHTHADTLDKVDPKMLSDDVAAMAIMSYILADMPARLGETK